MTLIIVVACVMIGALLLNVILPNATRQLVNQVEVQIHRATGLSFDFNGDGTTGDEYIDLENVGGNFEGNNVGGADGSVDGFRADGSGSGS